MTTRLRLCEIQHTYLEYLRQFEPKVSLDSTQTRKFIGVLFEVLGHYYCAPLSSPKTKHRTMSDQTPDVVKIDNGILGIINLNNMIPVVQQAIIPIEITQVENIQYRNLLTKQMRFIRDNEEKIQKKARRLYSIVKSGKHPSLNARCCHYSLLEEIAVQFSVVSHDGMMEVAAGSEENTGDREQ